KAISPRVKEMVFPTSEDENRIVSLSPRVPVTCVSSVALRPAVLWVFTTLTASRRLRRLSGVVSSMAVLTVRTAGASLPSSNSSHGTKNRGRVRTFRLAFRPRPPAPKNFFHHVESKVNAMIAFSLTGLLHLESQDP